MKAAATSARGRSSGGCSRAEVQQSMEEQQQDAPVIVLSKGRGLVDDARTAVVRDVRVAADPDDEVRFRGA